MSCGCGNPWGGGSGLNTNQVCGTFEEPENPDQGQCSPYRTKRTCEVEPRPANACDDIDAYAIYVPDQTPKFIIISTIFDEDCGPIQDQNGAPILGIL